ncbi:TniB family NTP-binding protein [Pseudomonas syringae group genomosp. 3]|uniref:TniB family NTP-binding protein n=1 Tax=Pseudomonas syringae group genomosp. 3 TaxID=251701 RepID=UPI000EFF1460|nr:TniB family NTP-binding protein [Pseudomonas syringae group genomosp. 3]
MDGQHVRPDRRKFLSESIAERISVIQQDVWLDYKPSEFIFRIMNNMARVPKRQTAPALLVVGAGGTGKSSIISQISSKVENSKGVIYLDLAESPEIGAKKTFRMELARGLGLPDLQQVRGGKDMLPKELLEVIHLRGIWGIVIDELHEALLRPKQEQRSNLSIIKKLVGLEYGLKVFAFGTDSARLALSSNGELKRRFYEYSLADWGETEEFRSFLLEFEEFLPLKIPSKLYTEDMVKAILAITGGRMDKTVELLRTAACYAVKTGEESISIEGLRRASMGPWGY